jgi:arginine/ornithine succinyltransferase subunit-like protein
MFVVRPVETTDIPALEALAAVVTPGVHTLPRTRKTIERAVERSLASFAAQPDLPGEESYFFVLDAPGKTLAGTAAIAATAGSSGTFFSFRNDVLSQVSRDLNISHNVHALTLCSDLTSHSQLSSFYMNGARRVRKRRCCRARACYSRPPRRNAFPKNSSPRWPASPMPTAIRRSGKRSGASSSRWTSSKPNA